MSVPCTFFVMSPESVPGQDFSSNPAHAMRPCHEAGGISGCNIAELEALLTGTTVEDLLDDRGDLQVGLVWKGDEHDGPWLYELSAPLLRGLATASSCTLRMLETEWGDGAFDATVVEELLGALRTLAVTALETNR